MKIVDRGSLLVFIAAVSFCRPVAAGTLPSDYLPFEYVASAGVALDTGIDGTEVCEVEFGYEVLGGKAWTSFVRSGDGSRFTFGLTDASGQKWYARAHGADAVKAGLSMPTGQINVFAMKNGEVTLNGSKVGSVDTTTALDTQSGQITIFNETEGRCSFLRLYGASGETLVDLIPCQELTGALRVGFYDVENGVFIAPSTGVLTPGPDMADFAIAEIPEQVWTSGAVEPEPVVTDKESGETLVKGKDYAIARYVNNTGAGTAMVVVTGLGDYDGQTAARTFRIRSEYGTGNLYYAAPNGGATAACTAEDPGTIAACYAKCVAADEWSKGDVILLASGDYLLSEHKIPGSDGTSSTQQGCYLSLTKSFLTVASQGKDRAAVLVGGGPGSDLRGVYMNDNIRLIGLTVSNVVRSAAWPYGGAVNGGIVSNCTICCNTTGQSGAGMSGGKAYASTFYGNTATNTGSGQGQGSACNGTAAENCVFFGNTANAGTVYGGSVIGCAFTNNTAASSGGAVYECATVRKCTFAGNVSQGSGGACCTWGGVAMKVYDSTFEGNTASTGGAGNGGAYFGCTFIRNVATSKSSDTGGGALSGSTSASNCLFVANTAATAGDSLCGKSASAHAVATDCMFSNHVTTANHGIVMMATLNRCKVIGNQTGNGVCLQYSDAYNTLFADNVLTSRDQFAVAWGSKAYNCTFAANTVQSGKYLVASGNSTTFANCIFTGTKGGGDFAGAPTTISHVLYTKGADITATGVRKLADDADFRFAPADGKHPFGYAPKKHSPAVDAADAFAWMSDGGVNAVDLAGAPRIVNGVPDIGCYEYQPSNLGLMLLLK